MLRKKKKSIDIEVIVKVGKTRYINKFPVKRGSELEVYREIINKLSEVINKYKYRGD